MRTQITTDGQGLHISSGCVCCSMDSPAIATVGPDVVSDVVVNTFGTLLSGGGQTVLPENIHAVAGEKNFLTNTGDVVALRGNALDADIGIFEHVAGGTDNVLLLGGVGADLLNGGLDGDTFKFRRAVEHTTEQRDQIPGFENGIDTIELSRSDAVRLLTGHQAFTHIGGTAFSNVAGQLRLILSGSDGRLAGATDGNGTADFEVPLTAVNLRFADSLVLSASSMPCGAGRGLLSPSEIPMVFLGYLCSPPQLGLMSRV